VKSCTRSLSSSNSSSVGGVKPTGCFVEIFRDKHGENAGMGFRRRARVDVRRRDGRASEAMIEREYVAGSGVLSEERMWAS
jgi:hypothetical protein